MAQIIVNTPSITINAPLTSNTAQTVNIAMISQNVFVTKNTSTNNFDVIIQPNIFPQRNVAYSTPQQNVGYNVNISSNVVSFNVQSVANGTNTNISSDIRNPQLIPIKNRIGVNFRTWDGFEQDFICQNRILECRGYTISNSANGGFGLVPSPLTSAGWPISEGNSIGVLLAESTSYDYTNFANGNYSCGFTGTGHENVVSGTFCTVSNVVQNTITGNTTFTLTPTGNVYGFFVDNVASGSAITNVYAWLPGYPHSNYIDETNTDLFAVEAINFYGQFHHIRFMQTMGGWFNWNYPYTANLRPRLDNWKGTANLNLSSIIINASNTSGDTESVPIEKLARFCVACNVGGYFHIPGGATQNWVQSAASNVANIMGNLPQYWEYSNEIWNGVTGNLYEIAIYEYSTNAAAALRGNDPGMISMYPLNGGFRGALPVYVTNITQNSNAVVTTNCAATINPFSNGATYVLYNVGGMTQINNANASIVTSGGSAGAWTATLNINSSSYSAFTSGGILTPISDLSYAYRFIATRLIDWANVLAPIYGNNWKNNAKLLFMTQAVQSVTYWSKISPYLAYLSNNAISNVIQGFGSAGYVVRANVGVDEDPAIISTEYLNISPTVGYSNEMESTKVRGLLYGLQTITYEGGYGADSGTTDSTLPNVGITLMRPEMANVMANITQTLLQSGVEIFTHYECAAGGTSTTGNGYTKLINATYNFSNNFTKLYANGSPRLNGIQQYLISEPLNILPSGFSPFVPRNLIINPGDFILGNNYVDSQRTNAAHVLTLAQGFPDGRAYDFWNLQVNGGRSSGATTYLMYYGGASANATFNVTPYMTVNTSNRVFNVQVNGANAINSFSVTNLISNTAIPMGNIQLNYGWNVLEFHTDTSSNISFSIIKFN